jgi:hypothetical protein
MDAYDNLNLKFLATIAQDENSWNNWCVQASLDDIEYAIELMSCYKQSLEVELVSLDYLDCITDVSDAAEVLKRFSHGI